MNRSAIEAVPSYAALRRSACEACAEALRLDARATNELGDPGLARSRKVALSRAMAGAHVDLLAAKGLLDEASFLWEEDDRRPLADEALMRARMAVKAFDGLF